MIQATIELYKDSAREAAEGLLRSPWALVALLIGSPALNIVAGPLMSLPLLGGFIVGALQAAIIGWYLSLVEIGVNGRRPVRIEDLREQLGAYFNEVISVLFLFFLVELLLTFTAPALLLVLVVVGSVVFNPAPEMIYQDRLQSTDLLRESAKFMQQNWPEWLVPHLGAGLVLGAWGLFAGGLAHPLPVALELLQMFGPWFGFIDAFKLVVASPTITGLVGGLFMLAFVHFFLLFRGHLYRKLRNSSRRGRAWQSRN